MKCQECSQPLCDLCSQKHNKLTIFANHHLYKFCPIHADGMAAYLCVKCVQPVCSTCIMLEHSEHETDIRPYTEGKQEFIAHIKDIKADLNTKQELYHDLIINEEETIKEQIKAKSVLNGMIEQYSKKLAEAKEDLILLNNFEELKNHMLLEGKQIQEELEQCDKQCVNSFVKPD